MVAFDPRAAEAYTGSYTASVAEAYTAEILAGRSALGSHPNLISDSKSQLCISLSPEQQPESPLQLLSTTSVSTPSPIVTPRVTRDTYRILPASGDCSRTDSPITLCTTPSAPVTSPLVSVEFSPAHEMRGETLETARLPDNSEAQETSEVTSVARFDQMMRLALQKTFGDEVPQHLQARVLRIASTEEASHPRTVPRSLISRVPNASPRERSRRQRSGSRGQQEQSIEPQGRAVCVGARFSGSRYTSPVRGQSTNEISKGRHTSPTRSAWIGTSVALASTASPCKQRVESLQASLRKRSPAEPHQVRTGAVFERLYTHSKERELRRAIDGGEEVMAPQTRQVPSPKTNLDSQLRQFDKRFTVLATRASQATNASPGPSPRARSRESSINRGGADQAFHERLFSEAQEWKARRMQLVEEHAATEQERLKREATEALKGTAIKQRHIKRYASPTRQAGFIEKLLKYRSDADAIADAQERRLTQEARSDSQASASILSVGRTSVDNADFNSNASMTLRGSSATSSNDGHNAMKHKDGLQQMDSLAPWASASSASTSAPSMLAEDKARRDLLAMKRQLGLLLMTADVLKRRVDQYEANQHSSDRPIAEQDEACSDPANVDAPVENMDPLPESPLLVPGRGQSTYGRMDFVDVIQGHQPDSRENILVGAMDGLDAASKVASLAKQVMKAHEPPNNTTTSRTSQEVHSHCDDLELHAINKASRARDEALFAKLSFTHTLQH